MKEVADAGYDFIKLTVDITPEVFDAIVAAARERRIPIVGHVDPRVGVRRALKAGQHIEHLDNYLESILRDNAPSRRSVSNYDVFRPENWQSLDFMDQGKLREIARETASSGTYTRPTLTIPKFAFALGQTDDEIRGASGVGPDASQDARPLSAGERAVLEDGRLGGAEEEIRGHSRSAREGDRTREAGSWPAPMRRSGSSGTATRCTASSRAWWRRD